MPQSEIIFSVQESPEGGYQARALGFSIFTEAHTSPSNGEFLSVIAPDSLRQLSCF